MTKLTIELDLDQIKELKTLQRTTSSNSLEDLTLLSFNVLNNLIKHKLKGNKIVVLDKDNNPTYYLKI